MASSRNQVTRVWLRKCASDLRAAKQLLKASPPLREQAAFHAQQASEKAFKAILVHHSIEVKKIHSLEWAAPHIRKLDNSLSDLLKRAHYLTSFATMFSYPTEAGRPTKKEILEYIEL